MVPGHDNWFCDGWQSMSCSSKTDHDCNLKQSPIDLEDDSLSVCARIMSWDRS